MDINQTIENLNNQQSLKKDEIFLNDEQKLLLLNKWQENGIPPSISDLVKLTFPNIDVKYQDGRSNYGRAIKEFLITKGLNAVTKTEYSQKKPVELTDEQKEYISNNCSTMKPLEMSKELFNNPRLSPASGEARAVMNFFRTIDPKIVYGDDIPENDYNPPRQLMHVLGRIRKYISSTEDWEIKKLSPQQKKCCASLIHYLHDHRFKRQIDSYERTEDKITFESEFIKYTYNKTDLEQEEISQYIALCSYVVSEFNIKQYIESLQTLIQREYEENEKISANLVDALESARQDLNNCTLRQGKLYESLTEKRSEKIGKELKDKASLLNLIGAWKQQESRQKIIELADKKKDKLRKDIHELENLDEMKIRLLGLSEDEIVNG
jgi:hypothetical protein